MASKKQPDPMKDVKRLSKNVDKLEKANTPKLSKSDPNKARADKWNKEVSNTLSKVRKK
jgi:hypothetical protein